MSNPVRNVVIHLGSQPVMLTVLGGTHFNIAVTGGNQPNLLGVNGGLNLLINQAQGAIVPWNPRINLTNPITNPPHWSIPDANDATAPAVPQDSNNANQLALGWAKLPNELKDEIIGMAMMAEDTEIHLPCLTYRTYKPNVAAKALRVNWHFYREGTLALYNRNMVTFDNFGSDLQTMCKSWNVLGVQSPIFGEVTLIIGDHVSQDNGFLKACSFANVLQHLKTPLRVQRLIIILERYHLSTREQFASFAATFMNVKVGNHLMLATTLIPALPFCWEFMTLQLTGAMHMDYTPLERIPGSAIGDPDARTAIFGRTKVWEQGEAGVEY